MDRFEVRTSAGEPCVRTDSRREAELWAERFGTDVIDKEQS